MTTGVRVTIDQAAVRRLTRGTGSRTFQLCLRVGNRVLSNSAERCPVKTGNLRSTRELVADGDPIKITVAYRAHYAIFVHDGTRYMAGRPFLRDALVEEMSRL